MQIQFYNSWFSNELSIHIIDCSGSAMKIHICAISTKILLPCFAGVTGYEYKLGPASLF